MGEGGPRVQTTTEADARCIADALHEYDATVTAGDDGSWLVNLSDPGLAYADLLRALRACLDLNGIASVQVVMSDRKYSMQGAGTTPAR
jgi:hypothetical protein